MHYLQGYRLNLSHCTQGGGCKYSQKHESSQCTCCKSLHFIVSSIFVKILYVRRIIGINNLRGFTTLHQLELDITSIVEDCFVSLHPENWFTAFYKIESYKSFLVRNLCSIWKHGIFSICTYVILRLNSSTT